MLSNYSPKIISFVFLILFQNHLCYCDSSENFQSNVDAFIDAFDDAYSTEIYTPTTEEIHLGNEVPVEAVDLAEGNVKVEEELAVTETVFHPGSDVKHDVTEEVLAMAEKAIMSISPQLKLINVTEALSMVTDKIQRTLWLVVARKECEEESCTISCRVELVSRDDVEEVTWHNCLDTATSNEVNRDKRGAVGGFKQVDEAEAMELAEIAVKTLDSIDADDTKRIVTQVLRAQKQLVNGIMYHLTLEVAASDCKEEEDKCEGKLSDPNICKILMQRLFSGEAPHNAQVIKSECTPISKAKEIGTKKRARRHMNVDGTDTNMITNHVPAKKYNSRILGGITKQDPNSDKIKEISEFALAQIDKASNSLNRQKIVRIVEARTQVVAGLKYFLKLDLVETDCKKGSDQEICNSSADEVLQSCDVVVWDKPWEKFRSVTKVECVTVHHRMRRTPGGRTVADPNDAKVQEIAQFAVSEINAKSNSLNSQKLVLVKKAETQVLAGTNYYLTIQLVETDCRKGSDVKNDCSPVTNKIVQECVIVVWDQSWNKHREMTSSNCSVASETHQVRKQIAGGRKPGDPNDSKIQEIAQFAVSQLNGKSNSVNLKKLVLVKKVETQVVAGTNYYLTIQLVETDCRKGAEVTSDCGLVTNKVVQECDIVVWDQPWTKHREITTDNCSPASETRDLHKRDVFTGGLSPQNKDSDEIKEVAQFAVEDLNKKSNSLYKQTLVEVISAHTQVVAGVNHHLKLRVAESECKKNSAVQSAVCPPKADVVHQECDVIVWSQPWLKTREVTKMLCKPVENSQVIGEAKILDPLAPEVQEVATFSLKTIDKQSNSMYKHALIRVVDAKVQTVSGKKYYLTVEIGESKCSKQHDEDNCAIRTENTLSDKCNVIVWDQPWLHKKEVLDVKCGLRRKRSFVSKARNIKNDIHVNMFEEFKTKYNKVYADEVEHKKRFRIFRANLKKIETFQNNEQGTAVYGPNMFADLTAKEFKQRYLGLKPGYGPKPSKHHMVPAKIPVVELPTNFDWRDRNAVTPVKNQGQCGSCWAFSVTGNIEGQWFLKHSNLLSLSEQELVDCDKTDSGCNGGYMTSAYEAIEKIGGLETEDEYPYDGEDETCKFKQSDVKVTVTSSVNITTNETQIAQWLFANGPISIGINANAMQFYMGGVSHPFKFLCSKDQLDHGVLLVGFGIHRTSIRHKLMPYWLVKNSWGPHWGEKGYYRVYRGDGTCGVNQMASSAVVG